MKKAAIVIVVLVLGTMLFGGSSEPKLVVDGAYRHREYGSYHNVYEITIKNDSKKDIDSVDYFRIYFYNKTGNNTYVWRATKSDLRYLALAGGDAHTFTVMVPESKLPYNESWKCDTEYCVNYY